MKTILHKLLIASWLIISPTIAFGSFTTLPTIPKHPSIIGFHIPNNPSAPSGLRNLSLEPKQQLDSIVVAGKEKIVYLYNDNGLHIMLTQYKWNGVSWRPEIQVDLLYNESNKVATSINYTWNIVLGEWTPQWKTVYTYNVYGQTLTEQYITYDRNTKKWENIKRYAYTYTNAGVITKSTHANWNTITNTWIVDWTTDYVYDIKKQRIADVSYSEGYVPASKTEYTYNANGALVRKNDFYSNNTTNRWEPSAKEEYLLDNQLRPVVKTYSFWNSILQVWENLYKSNVEFDNNGNSLSIINYKWNVEHLRWDITDKQEAQVNASGDITALRYFDWNTATNNWIDRSTHEWNYNENVTLTMLVLPNYYTNFTNSKHQVTSLVSSYNNNGDEETEIQTYYYSSGNNTTHIMKNDTDAFVKAYYNPTNEYIEVVSDAENNILFYLYDSKGSMITQTTLQEGSGKISISQLSPGTYLYTLLNNNEPLRGKLIKQ